MPVSHITDPLRRVWAMLQDEHDRREDSVFDCRECLDTGLAWPEGSERVPCSCELGRSVKSSGLRE